MTRRRLAALALGNRPRRHPRCLVRLDSICDDKYRPRASTCAAVGQPRAFARRTRATSSASRATNRWKSRIRIRVEHPIGVIKRVFAFTKVCYRGLAKNRHRLVNRARLTTPGD